MNIKNSVLDYIKYQQLKRYGNVHQEEEEEEEKRKRRRRKGKPRDSLMQEITTGMREKGINNIEWVDREE